jgi:hypothetical protein
MPYEEISKDEYERAMLKIKPLDFSQSRPSQDSQPEKFCDNSGCVIP